MNPLSKREREIAARIRKFRREIKCSRSYLAERVGVTPGIITRIELGRIPLKYDVARDIFYELGVNPKWVATGNGPEKFKIRLPGTARLRLYENELFSDVFFRELLPLFETKGPDAESEVVLRYQRGHVNGAWVKELFAHYVPNGRVKEFEDKLSNLWAEFSKTFTPEDPKRRLVQDIWYKELEQSIQAKKAFEVKLSKDFLLTAGSLKSNSGGEVKTEIQKLIELVKRKASKPGAKAELARALKVAPARISEWLSDDDDKKEPGGNYTLLLQKWVNGEL